MKTPPPPDSHVLPPPAERLAGRDGRFPLFVGMVLVALALGFKSELLAAGQVWILGAGLLLLATPALFAYLAADGVRPGLENFIPALLGVVAVAGLSLLVPEWWKYAVVAGLFGTGFFVAARLDQRGLSEPPKPGHLVVQEAVLALGLSAALLVVIVAGVSLPLKLAGVFALGGLASYRSFRVLGEPMPVPRAVFFSLFVAQLLAFFAWAMTAYLYYQEGTFAVMLFLLWYVNRGIIRHAVEASLSRNVLIEYGLFGLLIAFLFFTSLQAR